MTVTTKTRTYCNYQVLENGIHQFTLTEASRAAVDDFIDAMEEMADLLPSGQTAPVLIVSEAGIQPINYIFTRMRNLMKKYPTPTQSQRSKVAMIFKPNILINTVGVMMRSFFPTVGVRFFKPEERKQAMQWLLEAS